jgi:hypothetical protein
MVSPSPTATHWPPVLAAVWPVVPNAFPIMVAFGRLVETHFKRIGKYTGGREGNESEDVDEEHIEAKMGQR